MTKEHVNTNHTFAICAYKESPYLEECITSLMEQTVKSEIFIATSTPNKYIDDIAAKYNLKVYVNEGELSLIHISEPTRLIRMINMRLNM